MERLENIEACSYLALVIGVTFDHITTNLGITRFNLFEANYITKSLMDVGLWSYVDVLLCILFIVVTYISYRVILQKENNFMFIFPFISGLLRILISVWNISII
jgi:hypothetical protein